MSRGAKIDAVGVACVLGVGDERLFAGEAKGAFTPPPQLRFQQRRVGLVPDFDAGAYLSHRKSLKLINRASALAIAAGRMLLAQLTNKDQAALQAAGLFMGVGMSGGEISTVAGLLEESLTPSGELDLRLMGERGLSRLNPLLSFHVLNNMPLCHTSIELGIGGPHSAFYAPGPAAGLRVLHRAAMSVVDEEAPWAMGGGADAPINTIGLALSHESPYPQAEGAALLAFSLADGAAGSIEWLGLSEHRRWSPAEALQSLGVSDSAEWLCLGQPDDEVALRIGDTLAASGALGVAAAVARCKALPFGATLAVAARDERGVSVAALRSTP